MQPIKIFFSCAPDSDKDKAYVQALENHFADQKRNGEVTIWHVYKISPGANAQQETLKNLNSSDIILIFVSPDYSNNDYCVGVEGTKAALMQTRGIATVRVLRVRSVDFRATPFNFCKELPEGEEFISNLRYKERVLLNIAIDISALVKEARNCHHTREVNRNKYSSIHHQYHSTPVMTPIESLIKTKQTDDIKLSRLERKTDEVKNTKQTEEIIQRKTNTRKKQKKQVLTDSATSSEYVPTRKVKPLPKTLTRGRQSTKLRSTSITNWQNSANREYKLLSKGNRGKFFFYPIILINSFGIAAAILGWWNSLILAGLVFIISLLSVVIGAVNTGNKLPIPLALLYAGVWGLIIEHYLSWKPVGIIAVMAAITFIHFLLFHKNSR